MENAKTSIPNISSCPIRNVVARFGNKWSLLIMLTLSQESPIRFNELLRRIPDISSRVLSGTLRTLEADDLIHREVYATVPPKVEYSLTERGYSLIPILEQLVVWAQSNMSQLMLHRKNFENGAA